MQSSRKQFPATVLFIGVSDLRLNLHSLRSRTGMALLLFVFQFRNNFGLDPEDIGIPHLRPPLQFL